jgi:hypothetical protein
MPQDKSTMNATSCRKVKNELLDRRHPVSPGPWCPEAMNMRSWKNKLFLDAMPGRYTPLDSWIAEVVVLMMLGKTAPEALEEIAQAGSGPETDEQKLLLNAGPTT